jgi:hypothetical protein
MFTTWDDWTPRAMIDRRLYLIGVAPQHRALRDRRPQRQHRASASDLAGYVAPRRGRGHHDCDDDRPDR